MFFRPTLTNFTSRFLGYLNLPFLFCDAFCLLKGRSSLSPVYEDDPWVEVQGHTEHLPTGLLAGVQMVGLEADWPVTLGEKPLLLFHNLFHRNEIRANKLIIKKHLSSPQMKRR